MKSEAAFPLFKVQIEREEILLETMTLAKVPDDRWRYVDKKGHGHFWKDGKLPTLRRVKTGTHWVGDEYEAFEVTDYEYRCRQCGETIEPGMRTDHSPKHTYGPTLVTVWLNGETYVLSEQQYAESVEGWRQKMRELTGGPVQVELQ